MRWPLVFALLVVLQAPVACAGQPHARPDATLWAVQPPGEIVAFEPSDFSRVGGVRLPRATYDDPTRLTINGAGQILGRLGGGRLWLWDGAAARVLHPDSGLAASAPAVKRATSIERAWFLGDDGRSLYFLQLGEEPFSGSPAESTSTRITVGRTDLAAREGARVVDALLPPCQKSLRLVALLEPCPSPELWAPGGVVDEFFLLTHWEQVVSAEYHDGELWSLPVAGSRTTLFRRSDESWGPEARLALWDFLDYRVEPPCRVEVTDDGGCCGWRNASSNQTTCTRPDGTITLFDEWVRYQNSGYDVSFYTSQARIAPTSARVAFTVQATTGPAANIRLSSHSRPDSIRLASIRRSLADLPLVEIDDITSAPVPLLRLPHAELIGWLSDTQVVVLENHRLVAIDVLTNERRSSGIVVRSSADAFVVRR